MNYLVRPMKPMEYSLLEEFLYQAIFQPKGSPPLPKSIIQEPELAAYIQDFGTRPDDFCLCCETSDGVVGAVWHRIMKGYGSLDPAVPELAISLMPKARNQGAGAAMLCQMLRLMASRGYPAVSLSVQTTNPAYRLYCRLGFQVLRETDGEAIMIYDLTERRNL